MTESNLPEKIVQTGAFMSPDNLASMDLSFSPEDTILLVVDVQKRFFVDGGSPHMQDVAKEIAAFLPEARKAGVRVCLVYSNAERMRDENIDFCEVAPRTEEGDKIIFKRLTSAMTKSFQTWLKGHGIKNMIVCGGYLSGCVDSTVEDALHHKFNVCVARELVADAAYPSDGSDPTRSMREKGAVVAPVDKIRTALSNMPKDGV